MAAIKGGSDMKKTVLASMLLMAALAMPNLSSAASQRPGPYISGFVGVTIPATTDATSFDGSVVIQDRIKFDPGLNIGGTAGMDLGAARIEGEISYKGADIDSITDFSGTHTGIKGGVEALAFMANLFVDLHTQGPITPYFGGGIGFASLHIDDTYNYNNDFYFDDDDTVFAYQVGGGLEVALNRQISLDLGYRYFRTTEATFANTEFEFESHNATVGLRLKY